MEKSELKKTRKFGFLMTAVCAGLCVILHARGRHGSSLPLGIAAVIFLFLQLMPFVLGAIYRTWMRFALALGWFNTRALLAVLFFAVFTPVGLMMKLFGKHPIDSIFRDGQKTAWRECESDHDYRRMF